MATEFVYGDAETAAKMPKRLHEALESCHKAGYESGAAAWSRIVKALMGDEVSSAIHGDKQMHSLLMSGSCHHTAALGLIAPALESIFSVAVSGSYGNPDKAKGREDLVEDLIGLIEALIGVALPPSIPQELIDMACAESMKSSIELERDILSIRREIANRFNVKLKTGTVRA